MLYSISDAETACVIPALKCKATFDYIGRLRDGCPFEIRGADQCPSTVTQKGVMIYDT